MRWSEDKVKRMTDLSFYDFLEEGNSVETAVARVIYEMETLIEKDPAVKVIVYTQLNQLCQQFGVNLPYLTSFSAERKKGGTKTSKLSGQELEKVRIFA